LLVSAIDSENAGCDSERTQAATETGFGQGLMILDFEPGGVGQVAKDLKKVAGGDAFDAKTGEYKANIGEQTDTKPLGIEVLAAGQVSEGGKDPFGPTAAGDLSDSEERTPVVAEAVERGGRQFGIGGLDSGKVIVGPAGEFAGEGFFDLGFGVVEPGRNLAGHGREQSDDDRTVVKSSGE
jgi:hypothetical protein